MTVGAACQTAMLRLGGGRPATVFSSQNTMEMEISDLATEVATDIMKSHDWRALTQLQTLTGDGTASSFALPDDYDRMVLAQSVHDPNNWLWGYAEAASLDEWIEITTSGFYGIPPGWWIILGGQFQVAPTPASGAQATFPYISRNFGRSATGVPISAFANDSDTFVLDERLLTLGLIWKYKAQKGLEYAEDMATYEMALSQQQTRDKGASVIRGRGAAWRRPWTTAAYPWPLG